MHLSIIVPVFNAGMTLEKCLKAICNIKDFEEKCELIVADDNSTDFSLEIAKKYTNKIIRSQKNKGVAFTRNLGAKLASGEFLLFVDSDVVLSSIDILQHLKEDFARGDICGIAGVYEEETPFANFFSAYKHLDMCFHYQMSPRFSPGASSAILAISRKTFLKFGGFNESFPGAATEDIEFSIRIALNTGRLWMFNSKIGGFHFKKYTFLSLLKTDYLRIKGLVRIIQKKDYKINYLKSCPSSAFRPLISALSAIVLFFASIFYFNFLWLAFGALLLFFIFKLNFFRYLKEKKGYFFALMAVFFSFCELLLAGALAFYWQLIYKFKK